MKTLFRSTHVFFSVLMLVSSLSWYSTPLIATTHPGDSVSFYITAYGEVLPASDSQAERAHRVFNRVRAVADKSSKRLPQLVIVNSEADPWALALPDGHIVLSRKAVAICHHQVDVLEAEARLAFVLGHELAHLAHDDFWHREVYAFVLNTPDIKKNIAVGFQENASRAIEIELAADDAGFIYAALAGFPVDRLVRTRNNKPQFFEYWMRQSHRRANGRQPTTSQRTQLLLQRLNDLEEKIAMFHYGVRLSHFDYCDDAIYFLRDFQQTFPGRAVLNNLGYCYLQMARHEMDPQRAYFYWMPLLLDVETRAQFLRHRGGGGVDKNLERRGKRGPAGIVERG